MNDPIKLARKYAGLAEKATPGPWESDGVCVYHGDELVTDCDQRNASLPYTADLIAAAPDMARLLGDLANEVKRWINKAGDLLGTDQEVRTIGCIDAALDYASTLQDE